jgi:two-component system, cell cycle sensor histidine kinase and response regulator CckA
VDQLEEAKKRVLIVEDDDHVRDALEELLSGAGYRVIAAENGLEALDWLSRSRVDLIIADILMPGLAGSELIKRLRRTTEWGTVPILVLSGYADLPRYRDLPVNAVQLKPFSTSDLLERVVELIGPALR